MPWSVLTTLRNQSQHFWVKWAQQSALLFTQDTQHACICSEPKGFLFAAPKLRSPTSWGARKWGKPRIHRHPLWPLTRKLGVKPWKAIKFFFLETLSVCSETRWFWESYFGGPLTEMWHWESAHVQCVSSAMSTRRGQFVFALFSLSVRTQRIDPFVPNSVSDPQLNCKLRYFYCLAIWFLSK